MHNLTRGLLHAGHQVKVLCISTPKQPLVMADLPPDYAKSTRIEGIYVDTSVNVVDAFTDEGRSVAVGWRAGRHCCDVRHRGATIGLAHVG